jgi:hypothetical protein
MCKVIEALNTLSKFHTDLSNKMNIILDSEFFGASSVLSTLFFLEKYKDISKVAEVTANDETFVLFNCNNLVNNGLIEANIKKGSRNFVVTKAGYEFLKTNSSKMTYFEQFTGMFEEINLLSKSIGAINVDGFRNAKTLDDDDEEKEQQFMVI